MASEGPSPQPPQSGARPGHPQPDGGTPQAPRPGGDDVEASRSDASWSVAQSGWKKILPDLPDDVIALLATPVVVSVDCAAEASRDGATPVDGRDSGEDDEEEEREQYPSPAEPCAALPARRDERTPRFLAPALPGLPTRSRTRSSV